MWAIMEDESRNELKDYKIFCFDGVSKLIQVDFGRFEMHKRNLYTIDWKFLDVLIQYSNDSKTQIRCLEKLNKMLEIAEEPSKGILHVRVDFYFIKERIYFGELTFYHEAGYGKFGPEELAIQMGEWIKLPVD